MITYVFCNNEGAKNFNYFRLIVDRHDIGVVQWLPDQRGGMDSHLEPKKRKFSVDKLKLLCYPKMAESLFNIVG
jgi:hypothetical protein